MQLWMSSMADLLQTLPTVALANNTAEEMMIGIHTWTPNINKMCVKLASIYNEMKEYDESAWSVIEIKLRRKNGTKYEYHNEMKQILMVLLQTSKIIKLNVKFSATNPKFQPEMGVAQQHAILATEEN